MMKKMILTAMVVLTMISVGNTTVKAEEKSKEQVNLNYYIADLEYDLYYDVDEEGDYDEIEGLKFIDVDYEDLGHFFYSVRENFSYNGHTLSIAVLYDAIEDEEIGDWYIIVDDERISEDEFEEMFPELY